MKERLLDPLAVVPIDITPIPPTTARIAAIGRALPPGAHTLTPAQQRAWFGRVVFNAPVVWHNDVFVSDGKRVAPGDLVP